VHEKGNETRTEKWGIKWEQQYVEFERWVGMPAVGIKLFSWQKNQLRKGSQGLDAKIQKEIAENEEGTVWSERRARLVDCIAQKNCSRLYNKWEQQYADFKQWVGMPAVKSK
jgi:hypothetical protein